MVINVSTMASAVGQLFGSLTVVVGWGRSKEAMIDLGLRKKVLVCCRSWRGWVLCVPGHCSLFCAAKNACLDFSSLEFWSVAMSTRAVLRRQEGRDRCWKREPADVRNLQISSCGLASRQSEQAQICSGVGWSKSFLHFESVWF